MKIKRYTAPSMRSALDQVRVEQGADAVILSSRRTPDGIEVIAAVDYDETLMHVARVHRASAPSPAIHPGLETARAAAAPKPLAPKASSPAPLPAAAAALRAVLPKGAAPSAVPPKALPPQAVPPRAIATTAVARTPASPLAPVARGAPVARAAPAPDPAFSGMRDELHELRQLVERELASLTWNDKRLREPVKVRVLEELSALDIAPDMAMKLASMAPSTTRMRKPGHMSVALLAKHLPVIDDPTCTEGGLVAVVGPTGVGKTTTIAKLASRWCLRHGPDDLALVSTDSFRIGAREQLLTYARILGVPLYAANNAKELAQVLERLKSKKLTLIDTAGVGPRDVRLGEQLATLRLGAQGARVLLALPAQGEAHALQEITTAFSALAPAACILTKVDEAASLGAAMSTALRHRLPIAYLCNGQRVPDDLHSAFQHRVWMVRAAMLFRDRVAPRRDEAYLARHFGRGQAHA